MTASTGPPVHWRSSLITATAFVVALSLRPALTAVGPLLPRIGVDEHLGEAAQGLLGTLPLLAFAVASPLVHFASKRFGMERAVFISLLVLAVSSVLRSYTGQAGLWIGTDLGARAANGVSKTVLRRSMIALVALMALYMSYKALS